MYFSGLRKAIESVEEKRFYDVAIMYLTRQGYRDLSIVDGTGDGGRDVICSRTDLRIQLSVRKDWQEKINYEAAQTLSAGKRHLIYITNRSISPRDEADFFARRYKLAGEVDVSIHDLNRIATALAQAGTIARAYEMLGFTTAPVLQADAKEIAISSVLLFGDEAKELRESIVDANVRAWILKNPGCAETALISHLNKSLPGVDLDQAIARSISRLRLEGRVKGPSQNIVLSDEENGRMKAAEDEYRFSIDADIKVLMKVSGLSRSDSETLLNFALESLTRGKPLDGQGANEEAVRDFIANRGKLRFKNRIYDCLSRATSARHFQFAKSIDRIFATNTFDVYRALGRRTNIKMVLDTTVSLPMLLGLEFRHVKSRYGVAAIALERSCASHNVGMVVPHEYINEMASHGLKALDYLDIYGALPSEMTNVLFASRNAYLSHYSYMISENAGSSPTLPEFLDFFGLKKGTTRRAVENRIIDLLENRNIKTGIKTAAIDQKILEGLVEQKPWEPRVVVEHDAVVASSLIADDESGYIFATWDVVVKDAVENLGRIYADNPARIIDMLSMIESADYESDQSYELLTTLIHVDELAAANLAKRLDDIENTDQAYKVQKIVENLRKSRGPKWVPEQDELSQILTQANRADA